MIDVVAQASRGSMQVCNLCPDICVSLDVGLLLSPQTLLRPRSYVRQ
jgi:hypothetical protein